MVWVKVITILIVILAAFFILAAAVDYSSSDDEKINETSEGAESITGRTVGEPALAQSHWYLRNTR